MVKIPTSNRTMQSSLRTLHKSPMLTTKRIRRWVTTYNPIVTLETTTNRKTIILTNPNALFLTIPKSLQKFRLRTALTNRQKTHLKGFKNMHLLRQNNTYSLIKTLSAYHPVQPTPTQENPLKALANETVIVRPLQTFSQSPITKRKKPSVLPLSEAQSLGKFATEPHCSGGCDPPR